MGSLELRMNKGTETVDETINRLQAVVERLRQERDQLFDHLAQCAAEVAELRDDIKGEVYVQGLERARADEAEAEVEQLRAALEADRGPDA
jgi:TolA-binding protein